MLMIDRKEILIALIKNPNTPKNVLEKIKKHAEYEVGNWTQVIAALFSTNKF